MKSARVGDLATQIGGVTYRKSEARTSPSPGFVAVLGASNIVDGGLVLGEPTYVLQADVADRQRLQIDDILIATSSGSVSVVGKAGRVSLPIDAAFGAFCKVLRPGADVDPTYFAHYFQTSEYRASASRLAAGANINNLRKSDLDDLTLPLPGLLEQRRIASILESAVDQKRSSADLDSRLRSLQEAEFVATFGAFSPSVTVGSVVAVARTGPFGSQLLREEFVDEGIAVLGIDNVVTNSFKWARARYITPRKYEQLKRYTVRPGDVLITIMGTCGRVAIVPDDIPTAINTKHICALTLDQDLCLPAFLRAAFLWHPDCRRYLESRAKGAIMSGLNMGIIKDMPIPLPSLDRQRAFVELTTHMDATAEKSARSAQLADELFASLQARAFSGQL